MSRRILMQWWVRFALAILVMSNARVSVVTGEESKTEQLLNDARVAWQSSPEKAIELAGQAIVAAPDDPRCYRLRADMRAAHGLHAEAVADYDRAIQLAPDQADLFDRRGSEQFKLGRIAESIEDFDRFIALRPEQEPYHWKRGISYYYAGRYDEGSKQFEGYQTVDQNDVENAVWRYLCMARGEGVEKARKAILPIRRDGRVPMMEIYSLYRGDAQPEDVLRAVRAGNPAPERLNERLFYAHLYLGLWYEAAGDAAHAAEQIALAEKHKIPHYMWDVAHVHAARLKAVK